MFYDEGNYYSTISKKQLGVIFRNYKLGNLKLLNDGMASKMYELADKQWTVYGKDDLEEFEQTIFNVVKKLFDGKYYEAEREFNGYFYSYFNLKDEYFEKYINNEEE